MSYSVNPSTVAHQAPPSTGFSRQEHWSGLPCSCPGDLPNPRIEHASLMSPALAGMFFTTVTTGNPSRQNSVPQTCPHSNTDNNGAASLISNKSSRQIGALEGCLQGKKMKLVVHMFGCLERRSALSGRVWG